MRVVTIARKPCASSSITMNAVEHHAGALNIDACRISSDSLPKSTLAPGWDAINVINAEMGYRPTAYKQGDVLYTAHSAGRWPANLILQHLSTCQELGTVTAPGYLINRFNDGAKPFGNGAGHEYTSEKMEDETVTVWRCELDCPVAIINFQSGVSKSGFGGVKRVSGADRDGNQGAAFGKESRPSGTPTFGYGDVGGASRFFKQIQVKEK